MSDSSTSGFDRRSFMAGAAVAAVIPMTARAAGPAVNAPVAQDAIGLERLAFAF